MSTYKVIQDIEAEDHILGPLSLRQFIYGLIAALFLYLSFICVAKHAVFLLIFFLPPALFCGFFAFPFGKDQPTEVWALAKVRFLFKPRKRIWNQSGVKELVSITVPKKIEIQRTNGLSQNEVKSRLQALADTLDTRGWAIKNVSTATFSPSGLSGTDDNSERLLAITSMPQPVPDFDVPASADILDDQASPLAQQFTNMINTSTQNHRKQLMDELTKTRAENAQQGGEPQWFAASPLAGPQPVAAAPVTSDDEAVSSQIQARLAAQAQANLRLRTVPTTPTNPIAEPAQAAEPSQPPAKPATPAASAVEPVQAPVTPSPDPAILNLAKNNDLNVATLAREANKAKELGNDEVVIALH